MNAIMENTEFNKILKNILIDFLLFYYLLLYINNI